MSKLKRRLRKFKKFVKRVAKPVAIVAAVLNPALIPAIGKAIAGASASATVTNAVGAAVLSGASSAVAGDSTKDILKNAAFAGITAGALTAATAPKSVDMASVGNANATSSYTGATSAPSPSGMFSAPVSISSPALATTGGEGLFTSSSYTQPIVTSPEGLISPKPSVDVATSIPSITPSVTTTAPDVVKEIGSKGLVGSVLKKASEITGIDEGTLGKLGSAAVQTLITSVGANKIADKATSAAQTQADATIEAARIAADAAKFRPVGVTTRFGTSKFTTDAEGNVITAGYTPSAEITGYQDRFKTLAGQGLTDIEGARTAYKPLTGAAQSLFTLGQGYLAKSPEQAAQDYITNQRALLTPGRENTLAELRNKLFQQGRSGAAVAQGGNLMATSPELAAYYNSIAGQDLVLASNADQEARDRITFGSGLFDTGANLQGRYYTGQTAAYAPFATAMDTSAGLESLAERPLTLGTSIGERTTAGTAAGGRFLSQGITDAAATMAPSNAFSASGEALSTFGQSPEFRSALNNVFGVAPQGKTYTADEVLRLFGT